MTAELESLKKQREEAGGKAVLRDATKRLNIEIKRAREELKAAEKRGHMAEKSKAEMQKVGYSILSQLQIQTLNYSTKGTLESQEDHRRPGILSSNREISAS